jgi:monoamine oxidase
MKTLIADNTTPVVIVGAGMAGLTAAYKLKKQGFNTVVYEARPRLGGRTWTHYFGDKGCFIEEGGTAIDAHHYNTINLAKELGVSLTRTGYGSRSFVVIYERKRVDNITLVDCFSAIITKLRSLQKQTSGVRSKLQLAQLVRNLPLAQKLSALQESLLRRYYEQEMGCSFEQASTRDISWIIQQLQYFLNVLQESCCPHVSQEEIDDAYCMYTARLGMTDFVNKLSSAAQPEATVRLEHALTTMKKEGDEYILIFNHQGQEVVVRADYVIMTIPFTALRNVAIDDSIGLSPQQLGLIHSLPYGNHVKVGIPLYGDTDFYDQCFYYFNLDDHVTGWPGRQALTLCLDKAFDMRQPSAHYQGCILKQAQLCAHFFNQQIGDTVFIKDWGSDPWALGSYAAASADTINFLPRSTMGPCEQAQCFKNERKRSRLIFAGEHTSLLYAGHIEGAVESAILAARLLAHK